MLRHEFLPCSVPFAPDAPLRAELVGLRGDVAEVGPSLGDRFKVGDRAATPTGKGEDGHRGQKRGSRREYPELSEHGEVVPDGLVAGHAGGGDGEDVHLLGVDAADAVAIEDSFTGVASALAAGITTIGVPHAVDVSRVPGVVHWPTLAGRTPADLAAAIREARA